VTVPVDALLGGSLGAISLAIVLAVVGLVPRRPGAGVPAAVIAIERGYTKRPPEAPRAERSAIAALPGWLKQLALRLSRSNVGPALQRRLDLAGNPSGWTVDRILTVKGLGLIVLGALFSLYAVHNPALLILCAVIGGAGGFFLPDLLLYNARLKRQTKIQRALPDVLDMLTVCVEAGLGFDSALSQVAQNTTGPLAAEFARALQEIQIGKSRSQALRGMTERTTVPELRMFVTALVQAGEQGISIAHVLREQAREMRLRRRQRAEEAAQKVPVKIMFPLIGCLFPALFVIILGPGIINIAHSVLGV
jgi:tight adherence protein C